MPGAGTSPAITTSNPPARCLDITRLIRRAGRPMTGVDRVEFAYLRALVADPVPVYALARTRLGYVLLGPEGAEAILHRAGSDTWGALDLPGRVLRKGSDKQRRAEADLRRNALARSLPGGLPAMLKRHLPAGTSYLNTGHSNLTARVIAALRRAGARITVLIHDTIPLDHPEFQRPGQPETFRAFLTRAESADRIICNSQATRADCTRHMTRPPDMIVARLGLEPVTPGPCPPHPEVPYFVTVGTIEPRKNHALLLDIWDGFAAEARPAPRLLICGTRGWNNARVFDRLDKGNPLIEERAGLSDPQIAALLVRSAGLLFPSVAEGYGLPPLEAAALGVPVIVCDLPVYRETLGDTGIYLPPRDVYSWRNKIEQLAEQTPPRRDYAPPGWDDHFNIVLSSV